MARTVVLVDDSKFIIDQLRHFFEDTLDFTVVATGADGNEAVALYRKHRPDLIAIDICMPIKDGKAATREIHEEFPDARILIISAIRGSSMLECIEQGAGGYVEKPLRFNDADFVKDFEYTIKEIFLDDEPLA
jgi:two-component system chemotaxis response regulator CheY